MKKGLKIAILALSFVLVIGITAVSVWALTRTNVLSNFTINFIGRRDVEATISASSHYLGYGDYERSKVEDQPAVQTLDSITFDKNTTTAAQSMTFDKEITAVRLSDKIWYRFKITNNSTKTTYSDIVIQPTVALEDEDNALITSMYYTFDNNNPEWMAVEDGFVTLHKGQTVYLDMQLTAGSQIEDDLSLTGEIDIELYSELDLPAGYVEEYEYSIVGNKAYRTKVCSQCNHTYTDATEELRDGSYIIVNSSNVQEVLNGDIDNKTIVFSAGNYSNIDFKVTTHNIDNMYDSLVGFEESNPVWTKGQSNIENYSFIDGKPYYYERNINNVKLVGVEGAVIDGFIRFETGRSTYLATGTEDLVRNEAYLSNESDGFAFAEIFNIDNLVIDGFKFSGINSSVIFIDSTFNVSAKNITIKNCEFTSTVTAPANMGSGAAIDIRYSVGRAENVKCLNNDFINRYQGVRVASTKDLLVANCLFNNMGHNSVGMFDHSEGDFIIKNVNVELGHDRVFQVSDSNVVNAVIDQCIIDDAHDTDGQAIRFKNNTTCNYTIVSRTDTGLENIKDNTQPRVILDPTF